MKHFSQHIARIICTLALVACAVAASVAQTAPGTVITNKATTQFHYASGAPDSIQSNVVTSVVQGVGKMTLHKTASPSILSAGDTVLFRIVIANTGTAVLGNVRVLDTLSSSFIPLSSSAGTINGNVVAWTMTSLSVNTVDTLIIRATLKSGIANGTIIPNIAFAVDSTGMLVPDTARVTVGIVPRPSLKLTKLASADSVVVGTTLQYRIVVENTGNVSLTNVVVMDTIPSALRLMNAPANASVSGAIVIYRRDSLAVGERDSVLVATQVKGDTPAKQNILNTVSATSAQTSPQFAAASVVAKNATSNHSCLVHLDVKPSVVIGNGIQASVINAFITDTLGNPKPDGTPIYFTTTLGFFSNKIDSVIGYTKNGYVSDSVRAIVSGQVSAAFATVSVRDSNICARFDTIKIVFYPGAIAGVVVDADNNNQPVNNATVDALSSTGRLVGSMQTKADGQYLIPVPKTDTYSVRISHTNDLGQSIAVSAPVAVNVPGVGGLPPTLNRNQTSGTIYYLVSHTPIPIPGIKLLLSQSGTVSPSVVVAMKKAQATAPIDSTVTDNRGVYVFDNLAPGDYTIKAADATIRATRTFSITQNGAYVIDANSPVFLNPNLTLTKTGPTQVTTVDTATYTINVRNVGTLPLSNAVVTDSLDPLMNFVSASAAGVFQPVSRRVVWNVGKFDSLSSKAFTVTVTFSDSIMANALTINRVTLTSSEILPIQASAQTQLTKALPALAVTKTASRDTVDLGGLFTYKISVKNVGNVPLTNATMVDTIRSNFLIPLSVSANAQLVDSIVTWKRDSLAIGASDSVSVLVRVRPDAVDGQAVKNVVYARAAQLGQKTFTAQAIILTRNPSGGTAVTPRLAISKSVSIDTALVGSNVTYVIRFQNTGNVTLTSVQVTDTLALPLQVVSASTNATVSGRIISYARDSMQVNQKDSITVTAKVPTDAANRLRIVNTAYGKATEIPIQNAAATVVTRVIVSNKSCRIHITVNPSLVIGNGIQASKIEAFVTDTLGNPKPDGTPVSFRTQVGFFSNGLDSIVVPTKGGYVVDSLRAVITNTGVTTARAVVAVSDSDVCSASSYVDIVFYPGAIAGVVVDNISNLPVAGAIVRVFASTGQLIGEVTTPADGSYLIPVPKSDTYRVTITIVDNFGHSLTSTTTVPVSVPGTGGIPPAPNKNLISGKVYFLVSNQPLEAHSVWVTLQTLPPPGNSLGKANQGTANPTSVDSTITDSTGTFTFYNVPKGKFDVVITDPHLQGRHHAGTISDGMYMINVNIPIVLNPNITFTKVGPATAFVRDTVTYTITVANNGNLSTTNTVIVDSLDASMQFVTASAMPSLPYSYAPLTQKLTWNIGKLDSLGGAASAYVFKVTVRFADSIKAERALKNTAVMSSSQTFDTTATAVTDVYPAELLVTKQAIRRLLEIGDIATYVVKITNNTPHMTMKPLMLVDKTPFGFSYVPGSSYRDTTHVADPSTASLPSLRWIVADSIAPGATVSITYRLVVGAGGAEGDGINRAYALAYTPSGQAIQSAEASERVEVRAGVFTDHGLVIGKVFYDDNHNRYQDADEKGVKGVELMFEDGTRVVTGDDGKYSLPDVVPGEHVIRVRKHSIPSNAELEVGHNDFAGDAASRFVYVTPSGIARADFYLNSIGADTINLMQSIAKVGDLELQRITQPKNVVFIEDERLAPMRLSGVNFDVAKATLRSDAYPTLKQLANIMNEFPEIPLMIAGHTDTTKIHTKEFPSNMELSHARANAVRDYLVRQEGIASSRIATAGYGELRPVAPNKTKEGKALNRRVEFFFGEHVEPPKRTTQTVVFSIPIHYEGSVSLTKLQFMDELDPRLLYVPGSATLGDSAIEPSVNGNNLQWTITTIGTRFHKTLVYRALINQPQERLIALPSHTTNIRCFIGDSVVTGHDTLSILNQAAIAVKGKAVNFILSGVLFDNAKATLRSTATSALQTAIEVLKKDPTATAMIEGHTDSNPIRTAEFPSNMELSLARATTVMNKMASDFGIAASRLKAAGYGPYRPIATNATSDGRQQNRRVEIRIFQKDFVESAIQEGFVDSSNVAAKQFVPSETIGHMDSTSYGSTGDEFYLKLEVKRPASGKTAEAILVDSLPNGVQLVVNSIVVRGIDSVRHSSIIEARLADTASVSTITFLVELTRQISTETLIDHAFYIVRKEKHGETLVDKVRPITIELRRRQY